MNSNSNRLQELIDAWLEDRLTSAQLDELNQRLLESEADREQFREAVLFNALMHCATEADAAEAVAQAGVMCAVRSADCAQKRPFCSSIRNSVFAALAGVLVGVSFTSVAWAYVSNAILATNTVDANLVDGSFESTVGAVPRYFPDRPGVWCGDPAEVIAEDWAADGKNVVRLLQTERNKSRPTGPARSCDLFQIVDLEPLKKVWVSDESELELSARFSSEFDPEQPPLLARVHLYLFDDDAVLNSVTWPDVAADRISSYCTGGIELTKHSRIGEWQRVSCRSHLPSNARFVVVWVDIEKVDQNDVAVTSLGRHYIDDVCLSLVPPTSRKPKQ